jgi:hypothetical protein
MIQEMVTISNVRKERVTVPLLSTTPEHVFLLKKEVKKPLGPKLHRVAEIIWPGHTYLLSAKLPQATLETIDTFKQSIYSSSPGRFVKTTGVSLNSSL